jgi:hypothetical protein
MLLVIDKADHESSQARVGAALHRQYAERYADLVVLGATMECGLGRAMRPG